MLKVLDGNDDEIRAMNSYFDEDLSHRSFTVLNFLQQTQVGNLDIIFTKLSDGKNIFHFKNIIKYIFNKTNLLNIIDKNNKIKELEFKQKKIDKENNQYDYYFENATETFKKLGLDYLRSFEKNINILRNYKEQSKRNLTVSKKEYLFLLQAIQSIDEQIKNQKELKNQKKLAIKGIEKKNELLDALKKLCEDENGNAKYIEPIISLLNQNNIYVGFLDIKNYDKTIQNLKKQRDKFLKEFAKISNNLNELDYMEKERNIYLAEEYIDKLSMYDRRKEIDYKEEIRNLRKDIKIFERIYDEDIENFITDRINYYYSSLVQIPINFVKEDLRQDGFRLVFNYSKFSVIAVKKEKIEKSKEMKEVIYYPGSFARQTIIQYCTYLAFLEMLKEKKFVLPYLDILFLDNLSQALDNQNKRAIIYLARKFLLKNDIQIIITSDDDITNKEGIKYYNISDGLNPKAIIN